MPFKPAFLKDSAVDVPSAVALELAGFPPAYEAEHAVHEAAKATETFFCSQTFVDEDSIGAYEAHEAVGEVVLVLAYEDAVTVA